MAPDSNINFSEAGDHLRTMELEDFYSDSLIDKVNVVTKVITVRDLIGLVGRFIDQETGN